MKQDNSIIIHFTYVQNRANHEKTHTGEGRYMCSVCPAKFATIGTLQNHERVRHVKDEDKLKVGIILAMVSEYRYINFYISVPILPKAIQDCNQPQAP